MCSFVRSYIRSFIQFACLFVCMNINEFSFALHASHCFAWGVCVRMYLCAEVNVCFAYFCFSFFLTLFYSYCFKWYIYRNPLNDKENIIFFFFWRKDMLVLAWSPFLMLLYHLWRYNGGFHIFEFPEDDIHECLQECVLWKFIGW